MGCIYGQVKGNISGLCPFCRTPTATSPAEQDERLKKRAAGGDASAICQLGSIYSNGGDRKKERECWLRAGELGNTEGYYWLGAAYHLVGA